MNVPGYPFVFELNVGESQAVTRSYHGRTLHRSIKLISVKHFTEPNLWFSGKFAPENFRRAEVTLWRAHLEERIEIGVSEIAWSPLALHARVRGNDGSGCGL